MAPLYKVPTPNLEIAWKRMYEMMKPMDSAKKNRLLFMQVSSTLCWPALAFFGHYTLEKDYPEHTARHAYVDKTMPYMANPSNIRYKWGTPCTVFDFECAYRHRKENGLIE